MVEEGDKEGKYWQVVVDRRDWRGNIGGYSGERRQ